MKGETREPVYIDPEILRIARLKGHEPECLEFFKIKRRTEIERVAYLTGKYFTGEITLLMLTIQLNALEYEVNFNSTSTTSA